MAMAPKRSSTFLPLHVLAASLQTAHASSAAEARWCGPSFSEASSGCTRPCPTGAGCPAGEICFSGVDACAASTSNSNNGNDSHRNNGNGRYRYCGKDRADADARCGTPCPSGKGCPLGEACFLETSCGGGGGDVDSAPGVNFGDWIGLAAGGGSSGSSTGSSSSWSSSFTSSSPLAGLTGVPAVEHTFLQMKEAIDNELFLYETPGMKWVPSTVYRFDGFFDGLRIMHSQGVAGEKLYLGGDAVDCPHCHMYGLVNVAAFLAQAMKETIRYDACDENSWDRVGEDLMYPISNACGQLGQSYQDYHCSEEERHMECKVDPQMTITAVTNAKWWGAPGPLQCGPKSLYPQTGYWDYYYNCDNVWADPPEYCDAYEGQTGGKANNDEPYPNAAGRTDVEGCCWWGRGVIQTSGVCNFGKLNFFLGKRAADEGRESRYPDIDFCRDPEAVCSSEEHKELKWIAGFFYWISEVQRYDNAGWNYINELHQFVDGGMKGEDFINGVSGIVNRGCHNPPCGTGELDGGPERAQNFFDILEKMEFSFVDVVPQPSPPPTNAPTVSPQTLPPYLALIAHPTPTPLPFTSTAPPEEPEYIPPESPGIQGPPSQVRYVCGDGYQPDASDTSIPPSADVSFDYEIHCGIDVTVFDALSSIKASILSDIAGRIGCVQTYSGRRKLKDPSEQFGNIIGLQSNANDLPDPDAKGCIIDVETDDATTCTPVSGGFTVYAKPGTTQSSLQEATNSIKGIIQTGMVTGMYETEVVDKAIYLGDRDDYSTELPATIVLQSDETGKSDDGLQIAIYVLASACLVLLCLLWFTLWTCRRGEKRSRRLHDEDVAFEKFMREKEGKHDMTMPPQVDDYLQVSNRRPQSPPKQLHYNQSRGKSFGSNGAGAIAQSRHRSLSGRKSKERLVQMTYESGDEELSVSSKSSVTLLENVTPMMPQRKAPRNKSARRPHNSHRMAPPSRKTSSEGGSVSSDPTSDSSSYSSGGRTNSDTLNETGENIPAVPGTSRDASAGRLSDEINHSSGYGKSFDSLHSKSSFAREERRKRVAAARARAAKRRSTQMPTGEHN